MSAAVNNSLCKRIVILLCINQCYNIEHLSLPFKTTTMTIRLYFLSALAALSLTACQSAPAADKAATGDTQQIATATGKQMAIDTINSVVTWIGTKPVGQHEGHFQLNKGVLTVKNGELTGGRFIINIASLQNQDLEGEWKTKLESHLKSADFFDVEKYPTATFTITSVQPFDVQAQTSLLPGATHLISGNLQLKDSTRNITFPAQIVKQGESVTAKANFNLDRTQWGMNSGNDKSLQDKFIRPEVNIQFNIKAGE